MPEKQKFSWAMLSTFTKYGMAYLEGTRGAETKFTYALRRVLPQVGALDSNVQTALTDIEIDNCLTEKRNGVEGVIVRDEAGKLVFTAEGLKLCNKQKREHLAGQHYEIDPYFTRGELPASLTVDQVMAFSGLVFPADQLDAILTRIEDGLPDDGAETKDATEASAAAN